MAVKNKFLNERLTYSLFGDYFVRLAPRIDCASLLVASQPRVSRVVAGKAIVVLFCFKKSSSDSPCGGKVEDVLSKAVRAVVDSPLLFHLSDEDASVGSRAALSSMPDCGVLVVPQATLAGKLKG